MPNPLHNLCQIIHVPSHPNHPFLIITQTKKKSLSFTLLADPPNLLKWKHEQKIPSNSDDLAEAIKGGMLHLDFGLSEDEELGDIDQISLHITPPNGEPLVITLLEENETGSDEGAMFEVMTQMLSQPVERGDKSELRTLRAQLAQKDEEIGHLNAKLSGLKAATLRSTIEQNKKKVQLSPQKKVPANASALQPNQKRRKVVEDEFAGSSDEDE